MHRVGIGFDVHPMAPDGEDRPLVLGGVVFPGARGLAGHSDADVVVHALCDALLGALGAGDMGSHFPDTDPRFEGVSSLTFLAHVATMLANGGWKLANADICVMTEAPKIAPRAAEMRTAMARTLGVADEAINIKATRPEGLGALGRGEGIACQAIVLIARPDPAGE